MNRKILLAGCLIVGLVFLSSIAGFAEEPKKILCLEAYDMLNTVPDTYLIDVRTRAEYQLVGHPINAYLFPYMFMRNKLRKEKDGKYGYGINVKNKAFTEEIGKVFKKTDNLLIISRDGTRSALAAKELIKAGFKKAYDVKNGFEVLQELKKNNITTPVMVFTSLAQDEDREEVMSLGAKGYYVKYNIIIDELIEIIRRELNK